MAKKSNVRRVSDKKKNKPKVRFNIGVLIIIFFLSFAGCFGLYMAAANMDENFFDDEFSAVYEDSSSAADNSADESQGETAEGENPTEVSQPATVTNPVPESAAADASYLDNCCLITDSTLLGMSGKGFKDVIGNTALNAANVNNAKVESSYGTVTVYETLKIKKPSIVYLMLGSDIGVSSTDDMITAYTNLVTNLKASLPEMKIYIMQLPPVLDNAEKNGLINEYNTRLLSLADTLGVYCLDTNTGMKDNNGNLKEDYRGEQDEYYNYTINDKYYDYISGYILTHTA